MFATTASRRWAPATTPCWTSITSSAVRGRSDNVVMAVSSAGAVRSSRDATLGRATHTPSTPWPTGTAPPHGNTWQPLPPAASVGAQWADRTRGTARTATRADARAAHLEDTRDRARPRPSRPSAPARGRCSGSTAWSSRTSTATGGSTPTRTGACRSPSASRTCCPGCRSRRRSACCSSRRTTWAARSIIGDPEQGLLNTHEKWSDTNFWAAESSSTRHFDPPVLDHAGSHRAIAELGLRYLIVRDNPTSYDLATWANALQELAESTPLGIPAVLVSNPRNHVSTQKLFGIAEATDQMSQWPGELGLAATGDPDLVEEFGRLAARQWRAAGLTKGYMYMADIVTEPRWSRANGTFGENAELAARMIAAVTRGFQGETARGALRLPDDQALPRRRPARPRPRPPLRARPVPAVPDRGQPLPLPPAGLPGGRSTPGRRRSCRTTR